MLDHLEPSQCRALLEASRDAMLILNGEGRVLACNPALAELAGAAAGQLIGRTRQELAAGPLGALLNGSDPRRIDAADGRPHVLETRILDLGGDGTPVQAWVFRDITRQERLREECDRLAEELAGQQVRDPVTGLLNHRGLMLALEPQVSRCRRYNTPLSVITMEAVGGGEEQPFQVAVARLLKDQMRWADLIGRSAEGAFILVLPETGREDAERLTGKLDEQLAALAESGAAGGGGRAWACYGTVEWRRNDNASTLLRRAVMAMEQARAERDGGAAAL